MYGDIFTKTDRLRYALDLMGSGTGRRAVINRLYLSEGGRHIQLNISVDRVKYLIATGEMPGYKISKRNKKTLQYEEHVVEFSQIQDGSFVGLFKM